MRTRGEPRSLRLKKSEERRIVELLHRIPRVEPEIQIRPLAGGEFEVEWREAPDFFVPLEVGATGFYADYDPGTREFKEATFQWVARRVRVGGMWCLEVCGRGGTWYEGRFRITWHDGGFYRAAGGGGYRFEPDARFREEPRVFKCPQHLGPPTATAPSPETLDEPRSVGYSAVTVGGTRHECIRVSWVRREPENPEDAVLDDTYISREGRTILVRRFESPASVQARLVQRYQKRPERLREELDALHTSTAERMTYNDTEFIRWFDILTDASLGPKLAHPGNRRIGS